MYVLYWISAKQLTIIGLDTYEDSNDEENLIDGSVPLQDPSYTGGPIYVRIKYIHRYHPDVWVIAGITTLLKCDVHKTTVESVQDNYINSGGITGTRYLTLSETSNYAWFTRSNYYSGIANWETWVVARYQSLNGESWTRNWTHKHQWPVSAL